MISISEGSLAVVSKADDATMYRVAEIDKDNRFRIGLIDATIEQSHPNQRIQWMDASCVSLPNGEQLAAFIATVSR